MSFNDEIRHTKAGLREVLESIAAVHAAIRSTIDPAERQQLQAHIDRLHERRLFLQSQLGQRPKVERRRDRAIGGHARNRPWG